MLIGLRVLQKELLRNGRGKPRDQRQSMPEIGRLWYLIWLSKKYELDTSKFLECFLKAWVHGKSSCKDISIQCRQKTELDGVFLITQDQKVIAQLRLTEAALKHLPEMDFENLPRKKGTSIRRIEKKSKAVDMKIKDVSSNVKWINLKGKIIEKSTARTVFSRYGSNPLELSISTISDGTGSIKLSLWNDQIDKISIGDTVQIENGRVKLFKGELQVSVGKTGKLTVLANQSK